MLLRCLVYLRLDLMDSMLLAGKSHIFSMIDRLIFSDRIVESTLRTTNNLLERLHASFFFYILTTPDRFLKIGSFLPSAVLISVAMMFGGLKLWSDSAWILDTSIPLEKQGDTGNKWIQRSRPVIPVLGIMLSTHILGGILFSVLTTSCFSNNQTVSSVLLLRETANELSDSLSLLCSP